VSGVDTRRARGLDDGTHAYPTTTSSSRPARAQLLGFTSLRHPWRQAKARGRATLVRRRVRGGLRTCLSGTRARRAAVDHVSLSLSVEVRQASSGRRHLPSCLPASGGRRIFAISIQIILVQEVRGAAGVSPSRDRQVARRHPPTWVNVLLTASSSQSSEVMVNDRRIYQEQYCGCGRRLQHPPAETAQSRKLKRPLKVQQDSPSLTVEFRNRRQPIFAIVGGRARTGIGTGDKQGGAYLAKVFGQSSRAKRIARLL